MPQALRSIRGFQLDSECVFVIRCEQMPTRLNINIAFTENKTEK